MPVRCMTRMLSYLEKHLVRFIIRMWLGNRLDRNKWRWHLFYIWFCYSGSITMLTILINIITTTNTTFMYILMVMWLWLLLLRTLDAITFIIYVFWCYTTIVVITTRTVSITLCKLCILQMLLMLTYTNRRDLMYFITIALYLLFVIGWCVYSVNYIFITFLLYCMLCII